MRSSMHLCEASQTDIFAYKVYCGNRHKSCLTSMWVRVHHEQHYITQRHKTWLNGHDCVCTSRSSTALLLHLCCTWAMDE
mmetsp:Transcript_16073/g.26745  ORF Transcript_16073/g.26745 Transcript_16073/m.26745 type:complete len:80 (+) Transcript_16073:74-313(+)